MKACGKRKCNNVPCTNGGPKSKIYRPDQTALSASDVAEKLEEIGQKTAAKIFREQNITGNVLDMITEERLNQMGINKSGDQLEILKLIERLCGSPTKKVFYDSVHGHIELHPLCVKIVDTPQFQRLRYLKQLGTCYFVFPSAGHNRFEHCLGVCHLAGTFTRHLKESRPDLDITPKDVLCVEIAGLCHDLGHGPFSHMFEKQFMAKVRPDPKKKWKHEDGSVAMFDHMLKENNLEDEFTKYGLDDQDITFIKEQFAGPLKESENEWQYEGREQRKSYLYEIVANNRNGIDVDKWDYLARDCHGLGIQNNFDHLRFLKFCRVINVKGSEKICVRDKEVDAVYSMFQIRATLHRRAYQHRVCKAIEIMITDAFISAEKKEIVPGKDGKCVKISECIDDPVAFTNLNDSIFHTILMSTDDDLAESRAILNRIQKRQLYTCVGETAHDEETMDAAEKIESDIVACIPDDCRDKLQKDDIVAHLGFFDNGVKTENHIKNVTFYDKGKEPVKLEEHDMLHMVFEKPMIRLYCKKTDDESIGIATQCFQQWYDDKGMRRKKML